MPNSILKAVPILIVTEPPFKTFVMRIVHLWGVLTFVYVYSMWLTAHVVSHSCETLCDNSNKSRRLCPLLNFKHFITDKRKQKNICDT